MCEGLFPKEENVIMCAAPLFHILGQTCGLGTLMVGGTMHRGPHGEPGRYFWTPSSGSRPRR